MQVYNNSNLHDYSSKRPPIQRVGALALWTLRHDAVPCAHTLCRARADRRLWTRRMAHDRSWIRAAPIQVVLHSRRACALPLRVSARESPSSRANGCGPLARRIRGTNWRSVCDVYCASRAVENSTATPSSAPLEMSPPIGPPSVTTTDIPAVIPEHRPQGWCKRYCWWQFTRRSLQAQDRWTVQDAAPFRANERANQPRHAHAPLSGRNYRFGGRYPGAALLAAALPWSRASELAFA